MKRRVAVVGAGIVGAAVAAIVAQRGYDVVLFEQHDPGSAVSGASLACIGTHMIDEAEIPLLKWACEAWEAFAAASSLPMEYRRCGQVRFIDNDIELAAAHHWIAVEREADLQTQLLTPAELGAIEPALTGPIQAATWSPGDALVNPFFAVRAYVHAAHAAGAVVRSDVRITGIDVVNDCVTAVRAGAERIACDAVVLAAGPWTAPLAALAGVTVPIEPRKAQCLATVAQPQVIRTVVGACKREGGVDAGYTQIQQVPSGQILFNTVLAATEGDGETGSLDAVGEIDRLFLRDSVRTLVRLFPSLRDIDLLRSWVRYEAVTPDDRFVIGPAGPEGLYLAAGDGGTGFARAPAIGRIIADQLDGIVPPFRTDIYDAARFALEAAS